MLARIRMKKEQNANWIWTGIDTLYFGHYRTNFWTLINNEKNKIKLKIKIKVMQTLDLSKK